MMGRTNYLLFAAAAAGVLMTTAAQADTKAGIDAWAAGDYVTAVSNWQVPAEQGEAEAQFQLGQAYRVGKGVAQDLTKAEELYSKAAAQGHKAAADNYGLLLFHRGEKKQALPYLRAASDRGDGRAHYLLGLAYFNADGVERDWPRAYALVNLARKQGLEQASAALQQIDQHISADQRARGLTMTDELQAKIDGKTIPAVASKPPALAANKAPASLLPRQTATAKPTPAKPAPVQVAAAPVAKVAPPPAKAAPAKAAPVKAAPAKPAPSGPWRIQLGAFAERGNADVMWNRVKNRPELNGRSRMNVAAGKVTRLHAAGFASRSAAEQACSRLKSAGFDCIPVSG